MSETIDGLDPISTDLIACMRSGANAEYDDACAVLYRSRERSDDAQRREWQDAEPRAVRHEALLALLGPDDAPAIALTGATNEHALAMREALDRFARDFPDDPRRQQIKAFRIGPNGEVRSSAKLLFAIAQKGRRAS